MFNLLVEEGYPKFIGAGEAALDAVIGFIVVFVGISLLIFVVWLFGFAMKKFRKPQKRETIAQEATATPINESADDEITAVICAAVAAIYAEKKQKPEFVVKDTKRNLRG